MNHDQFLNLNNANITNRNVQWQIKKAEGYFKDGRYHKALEELERALRIAPQHPIVLYYCATCKYALNLTAEAILDLDTAIEKQPGFFEAYCKRSEIHNILRNFEAGNTDAEKALEIKPNDPQALFNLGTAVGSLGDNTAALAIFTDVISQSPYNAPAYFNRAVAYVQLGNYPNALADFNDSISISPNQANAYYYRATMHKELGDLGAMKHDLLKARQFGLHASGDLPADVHTLKHTPEQHGQRQKHNAPVALATSKTKGLFDKALAFHKAGNHKKTLETLDALLRLDPKNPVAHNNRGLANIKLGNFADAVQDYSNAIAIHAIYHEAYAGRADAKNCMEDFAGALIDANSAIQLEPTFPLAHFLRGVAKTGLGDDSGAIEDYNNAIKLNPDYQLAWNNRAVCHFNLKNRDLAIADLNKAIELGPDDDRAYFLRGLLLHQTGKTDQAQTDFQKAKKLGLDAQKELDDLKTGIMFRNYEQNKREFAAKNEIAPKAATANANDIAKINAYLAQAKNHFEKDDFVHTLEVLDKANNLNVRHTLVMQNRAVVLQKLGRFDEASAAYEEAIRIFPDNPNLFSNRALLKNLLKDFTGAIADASKALELKPDLYSAYFHRGQAKSHLNDFHGAIADFSEAIAFNDTNAEFFHLRGFAYYKLGDMSAALNDADKSIALNPNSATAFANRAFYRWELGDKFGSQMDTNTAKMLGHKPKN